MQVFAFDRDWTVDVNPHPRHEAVPLEWVRHLAHETDHAVYAIGNQDLVAEAAIPGVVDIVGRHPDGWEEWLGEKEADGHYEQFPTRRERLALIEDLHPDAEGYVVVDDLDLGDVDGWTHYHAWEFVPAVERGDVDPDLPWTREPATDGGCPTRAGIEPVEVEDVIEFLEACDEPPGFEITYEGESGQRTVLCASVTPKLPALGRPAAAPAVTCEPVAPGESTFSVRAIDVERLAVVEPPPELYTASAETPAEEAIGYRRLAATDPDAVPVESLLALLDSDSPAASDESLRALSRVASARPEDCTGALPAVGELLDGADPRNPAGALAVLREVATESPGDVAPMVDLIRPYLAGEEMQARRAAARCLAEVADAHPEEVAAARETLVELLTDDHELVRVNACWALGHLGGRATDALPALETLRQVETDDDVLTRELTDAFGDAFERLTNQPAGKNRSGFLGLYEFRDLISQRQTDCTDSDTGDAAIIDGFRQYATDHRKEVLLFSNDTGFVDRATDAGVRAQKVAFRANVDRRATVSWETLCSLLYMLAVVFGVVTLPKVTLYGVWNGKDGTHWEGRELALEKRSPTLAARLERDQVIVDAYRTD